MSECLPSYLLICTLLGQVKVMRAMFRYVAGQEDELSFEEGDMLYILDTSDPDGWWKARCNNKTGLIPSNYGEPAESYR